MIDIKEINTNIDNLKIIDPLTFKYITMNLKILIAFWNFKKSNY